MHMLTRDIFSKNMTLISEMSQIDNAIGLDIKFGAGFHQNSGSIA